MNRTAAYVQRSRLARPRNLDAVLEQQLVGRLDHGDGFVVSLVGNTPLREPHVYVDAGRRYDWAFASGLHAIVVAGKGAGAAQLLRDVYDHTALYPTFVDFDRKVVGWVQESAAGKLRLWPYREGSDPWRTLFA